MCTPWTLARLVRCRVGEWTSSVSACQLPSDDEPDTFHRSVPHVSTETRRSTTYDMIQETSSNRKSNKQRLVPRSTHMKDSGRPNDQTNLHSPPFREEDYIVFCFKENGAFHVINDEKPESSHHLECRIRQLRTVNRKLVYGEAADIVGRYSNADKLTEDGSDFDATEEKSYIFDEKLYTLENQEIDCFGEDEESVYFDSESPPPGIRGGEQCEGNEESESAISLESSVSMESDSSTSSFAFPVLHFEWSGSPIKIPNSEDLHSRKHKAWRMGLHCCRF